MGENPKTLLPSEKQSKLVALTGLPLGPRPAAHFGRRLVQGPRFTADRHMICGMAAARAVAYGLTVT